MIEYKQTRKFLGVVGNTNLLTLDKERRQTEKKALRAYLRGRKEFIYKNKYYMVNLRPAIKD